MIRLLVLVVLLAAVTLFCTASPALAWNEPDSFRGIKWGASKKSAESVVKQQVKPGNKAHWECWGDQQCSTSGYIGPVWSRFELVFWNDKFVGAHVTFSPEHFDSLRAIFIERYGQPTAQNQPEFVTKGGLRARNDVVVWTGSRVHISMSRYDETINDGGAVVYLKEELDRRAAERAKALKKGKGDL